VTGIEPATTGATVERSEFALCWAMSDLAGFIGSSRSTDTAESVGLGPSGAQTFKFLSSGHHLPPHRAVASRRGRRPGGVTAVEYRDALAAAVDSGWPIWPANGWALLKQPASPSSITSSRPASSCRWAHALTREPSPPLRGLTESTRFYTVLEEHLTVVCDRSSRAPDPRGTSRSWRCAIGMRQMMRNHCRLVERIDNSKAAHSIVKHVDLWTWPPAKVPMTLAERAKCDSGLPSGRLVHATRPTQAAPQWLRIPTPARSPRSGC